MTYTLKHRAPSQQPILVDGWRSFDLSMIRLLNTPLVTFKHKIVSTNTNSLCRSMLCCIFHSYSVFETRTVQAHRSITRYIVARSHCGSEAIKPLLSLSRKLLRHQKQPDERLGSADSRGQWSGSRKNRALSPVGLALLLRHRRALLRIQADSLQSIVMATFPSQMDQTLRKGNIPMCRAQLALGGVARGNGATLKVHDLGHLLRRFRTLFAHT
mmetsp:Transcript_20886/g.63889  ORF Transcript_20886/g.63889 Transcript_20886/m.63889 type:complete len:214 (+) Transcript_20886:413-1054(+)